MNCPNNPKSSKYNGTSYKVGLKNNKEKNEEKQKEMKLI